MNKTMTINTYGETEELYAVIGHYSVNNNTAIQLMTTEYEPYVTLTVNIIDLPEDTVCIDTNNFPEAIELIQQYNLGKLTGEYVISGFCEYPIVKLNMDILKQYTR